MVDYSSYIHGQEANRGLAEVGALLRGDYNNSQQNDDSTGKILRAWAYRDALIAMIAHIAKHNPEAITEESWKAFQGTYLKEIQDNKSHFQTDAVSRISHDLYTKITR